MAFRTSLKVSINDIDHAGIVYYPRFFNYFHVALEEFFSREIGVDYPALVVNHRIGFPTVHLETDFKRPLRFGDKLEVEVSVEAVGKTSITFTYVISLLGKAEVAGRGKNVMVCFDLDIFKKKDIPGWLREKLIAYQKHQGGGLNR